MHRSSQSGMLSAPASRLLRVVPRPAGLALAAAVGAAGLVTAAPAVPASAAPGACPLSGGTYTCTFTETGGAQTWTVPAGVTSATFTLYGAEGAAQGAGIAKAGVGAEVTATVTVTPGTVLQVNVGQVGGVGESFGGGGSGYSAAGGGGGGGGASDIRAPASDGTYPLANRLLVAGGGGGGGVDAVDGSTLANTGGTGGNADTAGGKGLSLVLNGAGIDAGAGGAAGTTTGPGSGGAGGQFTASDVCNGVSGNTGNPGVSAVGGAASTGQGGGAGGGGYYGGGGGGQGAAGTSGCPGFTAGGGGGGGGSSYPAADVAGDAAAPGQSGNGEVVISYTIPPLTVTTTGLPAATGGHPYSATLAAAGGIPPYSWSVTAGSLPPVLHLDSSTGVISGTPDVAGTYHFTVTVTDSESPAMKASKALSISVSGPVVTVLSPNHGSQFGAAVRIIGTGLACPPGSGSCRVSVTFGSHPALVVSVTSTEIAVVAPPGTGTVTVTVTVGGVSSEATAATEFTYEYGFGLSRFLP